MESPNPKAATKAGKGKSRGDGGEETRLSHNQRWEEMYQRLKEFKRQKGHCRVPNRYAEDTQLGSWVSAQRRQYRIVTQGEEGSAALTPERTNKLIELGFEWSTTNPHHTPWETRYKGLQEFVKRFGHADVPMRWEEDPKLSHWISKQRSDYKLRLEGKTSRLTDEKLKLLNDVGFRWEGTRRSGGQKKTKPNGPDEEDDGASESLAPETGVEESVASTQGAAGTGSAVATHPTKTNNPTSLATVAAPPATQTANVAATQPPQAEINNELAQQILPVLNSIVPGQPGADLSQVLAQLNAPAPPAVIPPQIPLMQQASTGQPLAPVPPTAPIPGPASVPNQQVTQAALGQMLSSLFTGVSQPPIPPMPAAAAPSPAASLSGPMPTTPLGAMAPVPTSSFPCAPTALPAAAGQLQPQTAQPPTVATPAAYAANMVQQALSSLAYAPQAPQLNMAAAAPANPYGINNNLIQQLSSVLAPFQQALQLSNMQIPQQPQFLNLQGLAQQQPTHVGMQTASAQGTNPSPTHVLLVIPMYIPSSGIPAQPPSNVQGGVAAINPNPSNNVPGVVPPAPHGILPQAAPPAVPAVPPPPPQAAASNQEQDISGSTPPVEGGAKSPPNSFQV